MTESRIEFSIGTISFSGQGTEDWLSKELEKLLVELPKLLEVVPPPSITSSEKQNETAPPPFTASLASYIKDKGGDKNQTQRFLATADWLRLKGNPVLTTSTVSKALADNQQKKLSNPSQCLNDNVSKGYCEKNGDGFFITPDGLAALGHK